MDTFFEQLIVRKKRSIEIIIQSLIVFFGVALIIIMFLIAFFRFFGQVSSLFVPLSFGAGVALYYIINDFYIEYEYSITNGYFDIDKIIGKRKRKRLISTSCSEFQEFGDYNLNKEKLQQRQFNTTVFAANIGEEGLYYAVVKTKKSGLSLIVIQPDNRIKQALKKFIPRQVQGNAFSGN